MEYLLIIAIFIIVIQFIHIGSLKSEVLRVMKERNEWAQKAVDERNAKCDILKKFNKEVKAHIASNNKIIDLAKRIRSDN